MERGLELVIGRLLLKSNLGAIRISDSEERGKGVQEITGAPTSDAFHSN